MRCHYDVLGVGRGATEDEIKKSFKKQSLRWHPDKAQQRGEDVDAATVKFRELQGAYECLSDPQERAFYDANRTSILRGDAAAPEDEEKPRRQRKKKGKRDFTFGEDAYGVNVWPFFSRQAYGDYNDDPGYVAPQQDKWHWLFASLYWVFFLLAIIAGLVELIFHDDEMDPRIESWSTYFSRLTKESGDATRDKQQPKHRKKSRPPGFYALYDHVFRQIDHCERAAANANGTNYGGAPSFGDAQSDWADVARFYTHFTNFVSVRSFREAEPPELRMKRDMFRRWEQKIIDSELAALRKQARHQYEDSIRKLALFCKKRDPRVARQKANEERQKIDAHFQKQKKAEQRREKFEEEKRKWRGEAPSKDDDDVPTTQEPPDRVWECTVCAKTFRTEHALESHLASKIHKKRLLAERRGKSPVDDVDFEPPPEEHEVSPQQRKNGEIYECKICTKSFVSAEALESHLQSKAHRKNRKAAQDRLRKMASSS